MDKLKNKIQEHMPDMDVEQPSPHTWEGIKNSLSKNAESDLLKAHITENKAQLSDIETPHTDAWIHINNSIAVKKGWPLRRIITYMSAAACIITIISLAIFRYNNISETNKGGEDTDKIVVKDKTNIQDTAASENKEQIALEKDVPVQEEPTDNAPATNTIPATAKRETKHKKTTLPPQVIQMEKDYDEIIEGQLKYTRSLAIYGESSAYFGQFKNDFKLLEEQEKALRKAIAKNGLQDNSIDELAMIYQQKLTVLKKLQNEINKTSSRNKNITDTIPVYINL